MTQRWIPSLLLAAVVATPSLSVLDSASSVGSRDLTFEQRVAAQQAIEQVYWNHRIWPKDNPGPKPPLSAVMSDEAIHAKVEGYLRMSTLLDTFWRQPITGDQLQAEITRMTRQTKAPETLRELFAALHDDPFLIAECLARPTLAQRRVQAAFSSDARVHGLQRAALAATLKGVDDVAMLQHLDGEHAEITYVLDEDSAANTVVADPADRAVHLKRDEWNREVSRLAVVPVGAVSSLLDRGDRFVALVVASRTSKSMMITSVSWAKRAYDAWARATVDSTTIDSKAIAPPARGYSTPVPALGDCANDTWTPTAGSEVPDARAGHTAVWTGSEMIVWGGSDPSSLNTGGRYNPSTDSWTPSSLNDGFGANVPTACSNHSAVWTGTEMIVWGATGGSSTGGRYNPSTDSWSPSSLTAGSGANVPSPRTGHTAVWTGTEMIVWGGIDAGATFLNSGGRYSPSTDSWMPSSLTAGSGANVPSGRVNHTAVWADTEMIVWGGWGGGDLNTGGRYNPSTDSWTSSSLTTGSGANVPSIRDRHTAIWTGTEMVVWGGTGFSANLSTGGRYNPSTDTWLPTSGGVNVPVARSAHTAVWSGSEMIVWGGSAGGNTGGRYNPSTDTWTPTATDLNVPVGRIGHTAVWTGTEMIVWGGFDRPYSGTGGRYNPSTDTWAATATAVNLPSDREGGTAIWTGSEMIVWGGLSNGSFGTGGRYDPSTDSWASSSLTGGSTANVPAARFGHTAVWTGSEMIVWGGNADSPGPSDVGPELNTGGRYNPSTDTWTATATGANVPGARDRHTAVWTGSEMIVWGGVDNASTILKSGGRYDPSTDSWATSSLDDGSGSNAPSARYAHTAVWTGSEMIVWGGSGPFPLRTGGRYNPSTDSWASSSLNLGSGANVPSGGDQHTAVWTGSEMIVWGGGVVNTGGRYNPETDAWAASSLTTGSGANVPVPGKGFTTVWTGSEMIVWGGHDGDLLDTGGRYNPFTDSWASSSLNDGSGANTPSARWSHTAVWTGSSDHRMIVWGGNHGSHTGGLYCAVCTPLSWYQDLDGDGHGDAASTQASCTPPVGYAIAGDDCDDTNPAIHPGTAEACNGVDDDCDGVLDNGGDSLCDDADVCTTDSCNGAAGCAHVDTSPKCDDADVCTADVCDAVMGCLNKTANLDEASFSETRVDGRDLVVLAGAWNSCLGNERYVAAANLDGLACVDSDDFHLFMNAFGHDCSVPSVPRHSPESGGLASRANSF